MKTMTKRLIRIAPMVALAMLLTGCDFLGWFDVKDAIAATSRLSYPVVDTGQDKTYNNTSEISPPSEGQAFYGQDAQVDGNQPHYVDNGDGTVTDLVTGLMWQQAVSEKMTYGNAWGRVLQCNTRVVLTTQVLCRLRRLSVRYRKPSPAGEEETTGVLSVRSRRSQASAAKPTRAMAAHSKNGRRRL